VAIHIRIKRGASSGLFLRTLLPLAGTQLLCIFGAQSKNTAGRAALTGTSLITAGLMLNPTNLGLPENTNGVPYATALVLLHMFVASVILGISVWESQQEWKMGRHLHPGKWQRRVEGRNRWERAAKHFDSYREVGPDAIDEGTASSTHVSVIVEGEKNGAPAEKQFESYPRHHGVTRRTNSRIGTECMELPYDKRVTAYGEAVVGMLAELPQLLDRAAVEPMEPHEPDEYFALWELQHYKIEPLLRYVPPVVYALGWLFISIGYLA